MPHISLEEAKQHLACDHNEDDAYIISLLEVAEETVQNMINQPLYMVYNAKGELPPPLRHAMKLIIGKLYREREGDVQTRSTEVAFTLANLFMPYRRER